MKYVRWILSIVLLYGVYKETGLCTTTALGLVMVTVEVDGYLTAKIIKTIIRHKED